MAGLGKFAWFTSSVDDCQTNGYAFSLIRDILAAIH